jgi:pimeloyl-ACP methyl ester carboxylesterase
MHWARNIAPLVAAGRMVCAPDLPGFGDSAPCGSDVDGMVAPLATGLVAALGDVPHDIVAFSLGSLAAVLLAREHPTRVSRLLLVAPLVLPLPPRAGVGLKPWRHIDSPEARADVHRANLAALMLHAPGAVDEAAVHIQQSSAERDRLPRRRLSNTGLFLDCLPHLECPTTAVFGQEDILFRARWPEVLGALSRSSCVAEPVMIPAAGHWVQYECAAAFDAVLAGWASGVPQRRSRVKLP